VLVDLFLPFDSDKKETCNFPLETLPFNIFGEKQRKNLIMSCSMVWATEKSVKVGYLLECDSSLRFVIRNVSPFSVVSKKGLHFFVCRSWGIFSLFIKFHARLNTQKLTFVTQQSASKKRKIICISFEIDTVEIRVNEGKLDSVLLLT
jgi:hypothetical protein